MKKGIGILVTFILLVFISSCTKDNEDLIVPKDPIGSSVVLEEQVVTNPNTLEPSDIAKMYIVALDSLMDMDSGLNGDMAYISIECATLPDIEEHDIQAILSYFSEKYNIDTMNKSVTACYEEGYGDYDTLSLDGIVLYSESVTYSKKKEATIECVKYRSGLGAIGVTVKLKYTDQWLIEESGMSWIS